MTDVSNRNRVQAGVPTGGQFATEAKTENGDLGFDDTDLDPRCPELDALKPRFVNLYFVDRDEKLSDEQLNTLFEGGFQDVQTEYLDNAWQYIDTPVEQETRDWLARAHAAGLTEREYEDLTEEEREAFSDAIQEADDSDPVNDMARNTNRVLLRAAVTDEVGSLVTEDIAYPDTADMDSVEAVVPARVEALRKALAEKGLTVEDDELAELARTQTQWHEGVRMDIVWASDASDVIPDWDPANRTEVGVTSPHVLLVDGYNGTCYDAQASGTMKITYPERGTGEYDKTFDSDTVPFVDGSKHGYGLDQIAGVVKSAYRADTTRNTYYPDKLRSDAAQINASLAEDNGLDINVRRILQMPADKAGPRAYRDAILMTGAWASRGEQGHGRRSRDSSFGAIANGFLPRASREESAALASRVATLYANDAQVASDPFQRSVVTEWAQTTGQAYDEGRYSEAADWKARQVVEEAVEKWA